MFAFRHAGHRTAESKVPIRVRQAIHCLLEDYEEAVQPQQRAHVRRPFFRPVTIQVGGENSPQLLAYTRDISEVGCGLIHMTPLECGEVLLTIPARSGNALCLRTRIAWCEPWSDGWYTSGGFYLDVQSAPMPPESSVSCGNAVCKKEI